ncbi:hypothetical protein B296_00004017 [Ensete ventricosum]|uniref:Uncharacterized protein n=1 Tax=Ensete ventricosum TaxID=4639 RepID=A0A426ZGT5_ENSVE|nr:hypothetical protein B296_00004017 [Ensete ventricosum]
MGLITHNMIYVCIDTSPCPVIVDLIVIGSDALALPFCPHPTVGAAAAVVLCVVGSRLADKRPPLWQASLPLGGSSFGCCAHSSLPYELAPLWALPLRVLPTPASTTPASASHAHGLPRLLVAALVTSAYACWRLPLAGWPRAASPTGPLAVAGYPCRGPGHGWLPFLTTFTSKIQQQCVERFYVIQSHRMQIKSSCNDWVMRKL